MFSLFTFHQELIGFFTAEFTNSDIMPIPKIFAHVTEDITGTIIVIENLIQKPWDSDRSKGVEINFTTAIYDETASMARCDEIAQFLQQKIDNFIPAHLKLVNLTLEEQQKLTFNNSPRQQINLLWRLVGEFSAD